MGVYYANSLAAIRSVLGKMPALGSSDAIFTLHDASEIPPANFSAGEGGRKGGEGGAAREHAVLGEGGGSRQLIDALLEQIHEGLRAIHLL
jgi:hypothetical protein